MKNEDELKTWRLATVILILITAFVSFTEHFVVRLFDIVFEICIFYVPLVTIVVLFLYFKRRMKS